MARVDEDDDGLEDWESEDPDESDADDEESLVACPRCGKMFLEDAVRCPKCGEFQTEEDRPSNKPIWMLATVIVLLIFFVIAWVL